MQTEFLIIGQGISGTWLSYYLQKANRSFLVMDNNQPDSASRVAAGIINPVTGRRIVKTWMIDDLLAFIFPAYEELGTITGTNAIIRTTLIDFHTTPQMKLAFESRVLENADFLSLPEKQDENRKLFSYNFGYGEVQPCYLVNLKDILPVWRNRLRENNQLLEEEFSDNLLKLTDDGIQYKNISASKIIFCDGIMSAKNPYFKNLPFALNKGEALLIESDQLPAGKLFKKGMMLAPWSENIFWVGSNYLWEFDDGQPSSSFRKQAETLLNNWLRIPYKIIDHRASIRPANLERRPFAGLHPVYKQLGILNGMGTKGCSLAPFFAWQLVDMLVNGSGIMPEADISRFNKILSRS